MKKRIVVALLSLVLVLLLPVLVSAQVEGDEYNPRVAYDPGNNLFLAVYSHYTAGTSQIWGRVLDASGSILGTPTLLYHNPPHNWNPRLAYDSVNGGFLVVWEHYALSSSDIYGKYVKPNSDGTITTFTDQYNKDITVNCDYPAQSGFYKSNPAIAYDSMTGNFMVVWVDDRNFSLYEYDIYGQIVYGYPSGGGTPSPPLCFHIMGGDADIIISNDHADQLNPAIANDSVNHKFIVAWDDHSIDVAFPRVYGGIFTPIGGSENLINIAPSIPTRNTNSAIAYDNVNQRVMATYQSNYDNPPLGVIHDVNNQRFLADGTPFGAGMSVQTTGGASVYDMKSVPDVVYLPGGWLVAWAQSNSGGTGQTGINYQFFLDQPFMSSSYGTIPGLGDYPSLAYNPNNSKVLVAFERAGSPPTDPTQIAYSIISLDQDGDGLDDYWEIFYFGSTGDCNPGVDSDGDGLTNLQEFQASTNPTLKDTDGDGYSDSREVAQGTDPNNPASYLGVPDTERSALVDLYNSTSGTGWTFKTNWLDYSVSECSWYGITCTENHVSEINLAANNLRGMIPSSIGALDYLQSLNLKSNQLSGSMPAELGDLTVLQSLALNNNQLSESIPEKLGNLANLMYLFLNYNQLSGSIPVQLKNLANLKSLGLNSNQLTGVIPTELSNLGNLQYLNVASNNLTGEIPVSLTSLTQLTNTDLRWNGLYTTDNALRTFLNNRQVGGDWESTQTVAPTNLTVTVLSKTSRQLTWTPIAYTGNTGGYEVWKGTLVGLGIDWSLEYTTPNKSTDNYIVTGLTPGGLYHFKLRTVTYPHTNNQNTVYSEYTLPTSMGDDFSGDLIDRSLWSDLEFVRRINNGVVESALRTYGSWVSNNMVFPNPDLISSIKTNVTVTKVLNEGAWLRARIEGKFYRNPEGHDIHAQIGIRHTQGGGLEGYYGILECHDEDCLPDSQTTIEWAYPSGWTVTLGQSETLSLSWVGGTVFKFKFGDNDEITRDVSADTNATYAGTPVFPFKGFGLRNSHPTPEDSGGGYIAATFDNVYKNGESTVYDDFNDPSGLIDETRWARWEFVREVKNGVFETELTRYDSNGGNNTNFLEYQQIMGFEADLKVIEFQNNGARPQARLYAALYNDGTGNTTPGDLIGDVIASVGILDQVSGPQAFYAVSKCTEPACNLPGEYKILKSGFFGKDVQLNIPYRFGISWNGLNVTFSCDDGESTEVISYNPTTLVPIGLGDSGLPKGRKGIGTRVSEIINDTEWAHVFATIDNAVITKMDTDLDGLDDAWEIAYFGNLSQGPLGNFDDDALTNLQEYQFGTNPNIPDCFIPASPSDPSPANGATEISTTAQTLTWASCDNANSYDVYFGPTTNPPFVGNVIGTSYALPTLNPNTTYYWKIVAKHNCGKSTSGELWSFTTVPAIPAPPTLSSPSNGETGVGLSPTLSWNASNGATSYWLQVSADNFSTSIFDSSVTSTSQGLSGLLNETTYSWRVYATNTYGQSAWSDVWTFITQPPYGNLFEGVRGITDPDLDFDGIDDDWERANLSNISPNYKTLFVRPKQEIGLGQYQYWDGFIALFPDSRQGFANIPGLKNAGIEVVVIGAPDHLYAPLDDFNYDPATDPNHPNCDILELIYKRETAYCTFGSQNYGHTFFSSNGLAWSWDTKGYTPSTAGIHGYKTPQIYPFPLNNYMTEGAYPSLNVNQTPIATSCSTNCANKSPMNVNATDSVNGLPDGTVEFNPIVFDNQGKILSITQPIPTTGYDRDTVLRRTIVHELGHALLAGLDSDHCPDPNCIMYESMVNWEMQDFGPGGCVHKPGGSKDIRASGIIHNSVHGIVAIPAAPTLASPANGAIDVVTSPTLTWNASTGATSYGLQVSTVSDFSTTLVNQSTITSTSYAVSNLANNTTYYWRVNATNSGGTSAWSSPVWSFTTAPAPPAAPTLSSPINGATGVVTNPTLSWNASTGATSYGLQVSTSSSFTTTVVNQTGITSTSYPVSGLAGNTTYYWRVNATNAGGTGAWSSPVWSFTTAPAPPAAPTLASPANGSATQTTSPTLTWNASTGATSYGLQVSTVSDFSTTVVNQTGITSTSRAISGLSNNMTYYWRVNATNTAGTSAWSSTVWSFTTVPGAPSLISPPNQTSPTIRRPPTLTWNAPAGGAASYQVQVSTSSSFGTTVFNQSGITATSQVINGLSARTYYWRVRASNAGGGTGAWSSTWRFRTN
jgi:hypothetical protein